MASNNIWVQERASIRWLSYFILKFANTGVAKRLSLRENSSRYVVRERVLTMYCQVHRLAWDRSHRHQSLPRLTAIWIAIYRNWTRHHRICKWVLPKVLKYLRVCLNKIMLEGLLKLIRNSAPSYWGIHSTGPMQKRLYHVTSLNHL